MNGTNPLLLLGELRELGALRIQVDTAAVPPLGEIDPERCYLAWDMVLTTAAAPEAIRDVFIFVEDECELTIEAAGRELGRNRLRARGARQPKVAPARAARPRSGLAPPPFACRPKSWISWSTWWASWSRCRPG